MGKPPYPRSGRGFPGPRPHGSPPSGRRTADGADVDPGRVRRDRALEARRTGGGRDRGVYRGEAVPGLRPSRGGERHGIERPAGDEVAPTPEAMRTMLADAKLALERQGLEHVETVLLEGSPADRVLAYAETNPPRTHRGRFPRTLRGRSVLPRKRLRRDPAPRLRPRPRLKDGASEEEQGRRFPGPLTDRIGTRSPTRGPARTLDRSREEPLAPAVRRRTFSSRPGRVFRSPSRTSRVRTRGEPRWQLGEGTLARAEEPAQERAVGRSSREGPWGPKHGPHSRRRSRRPAGVGPAPADESQGRESNPQETDLQSVALTILPPWRGGRQGVAV